VIWRAFKRSSPSDNETAWWQQANAAADAVTAEAIAALRAELSATGRSADDLERQEEMVEGLEQLLASRSEPLPMVHTQHRVIGDDVCHFVAPATLSADVDAPGKIFVTSRRLIFAGGRVQAWPWHRVRRVVRIERALAVSIAGGPEDVHFTCNTYGDAMVAAAFANQIRRRDP
jgi:hypothetical protein